MIVIRLCGGLGNQLFQYAAGRSLAARMQTKLVLDLDWYRSTPQSNTPRDYELWRYPVVAEEMKGKKVFWCKLHGHRLLGRFRFPWGGLVGVREKGYDFDASVFDLPPNAYLSGYWQSFKYFEDVQELIRKELTPLVPPSEEDKKIISQILVTNSVSVHVRRGDYISKAAAAKTHGSCSLGYYQAALTKVLSFVADPHFYIFSDDMAWVKQNLSFPGAVTFVEHNDPKNAFQDIRLMSMCNHHIIANSSFSWWGAWLCANPAKSVIAPERWFADHRPTPTLIPPGWIRI